VADNKVVIMTDAKRILAEARERIARVDRIVKPTGSPPSEQTTHASQLPPFEVEDANRKWAREADLRTRQRAAAVADRRAREQRGLREQRRHELALAQAQAQPIDWSAWNSWCDQRIAVAVAAEREQWEQRILEVQVETLKTVNQAIVTTLGTTDKLIAEAVRKVLTNTDELLKKFDVRVRQCLAEDRAQVLDMPSPLRPRSMN
jgi:hypothetical protein